jgi:uncharacterized membrane protein
MDRMLVVVFDNDAKAYEALKKLQDLDDERSLTLYAYAIVKRNPDGTLTTEKSDDVGPVGTLLGTSLGSVIGLLGGPTGAVVGGTAGMTAGSFFDLHNARIGSDYLEDVSKALTSNKTAVVAQIDEDWITPVDSRMEELGGDVYRRGLSEARDAANKEDLAAMKADLAQFKAEHGKAAADRQAKIQLKINQLDTKIQAHQQKVQEQVQAAARVAEAKVRRAQDSAVKNVY